MNWFPTDNCLFTINICAVYTVLNTIRPQIFTRWSKMRYVTPLPDIVLNFPFPTGIRKLIFQQRSLIKHSPCDTSRKRDVWKLVPQWMKIYLKIFWQWAKNIWQCLEVVPRWTMPHTDGCWGLSIFIKLTCLKIRMLLHQTRPLGRWFFSKLVRGGEWG